MLRPRPAHLVRIPAHQYPDHQGITTTIGEDGTVYVARYTAHPSTHPPTPPPVSDSHMTNLVALNPLDGSLRWQAAQAIDEHPLLQPDGDTLIVGQPDAVSLFRTRDGHRLWQDLTVWPDLLSAEGQVVCVQSGQTLYLLKHADGKKVWQQTVPGAVQAAPLIVPA